MQNKKRTGLISILIIILCLSVCIGATYAYFTDSVKSEGNIIKSGKLDVTMEWANGTTDPANTSWTDASTGAIFNYDLWEPGYTEVRHIRIKNVGNLAFQYKLVIVANGEVTDLADVIDVYYCDPAVRVADRTDLTDNAKLGTLTQALAGMDQTATGNLKAGESVTVTIALKMQEDADNKYQELSIGTDFSIQLYATQYTYESDAFDHLYDCLHTETEVIAGYPATYEETGLTDGEKCATCEKILVEQEEIPMLDDLIFTLNADRNSYSVSAAETLTNSNVVIPATYKGLPVTRIANYAFTSENNITVSSVVIPNSVTTIGEGAFWCQTLESITIPSSVTSIGLNAFQAYAYPNPRVSIVVEDGNTKYYSEGNCLIEKDSGTLLLGCNTSVIPQGVTSIAPYAFEGLFGLTSITIPNSVENIEDAAFYNCVKLVEVYDLSELGITAGSTDNGGVGQYALAVYTSAEDDSYVWTDDDGYVFFENDDVCYLLGYTGSETTLTLPENCNGKPYAIYQYSLSRIPLTSVTIGNGVTSIGDYAFYYCSSLTNVTIGNGVTSIGDSAFSGCSMTSITIPKSVTNIGRNAFPWTLKSVTFENASGWWYASYASATSGTSIDVTDPETAATYLKSTYRNKYWCCIDYWAMWATVMEINTTYTANFTTDSEKIYYVFTAPQNGTYMFSSSSSEVTDADCELYDVNKNRLTYYPKADYPLGLFTISYELTEGETYYLVVQHSFSNGRGALYVTVTAE